MKLLVFMVTQLLMSTKSLNVPLKKSVQRKIDNGDIANPGDFPYHVAIHTENELLGSGSLIASDWVLTVNLLEI